jgi:hypothetical protein
MRTRGQRESGRIIAAYISADYIPKTAKSGTV